MKNPMCIGLDLTGSVWRSGQPPSMVIWALPIDGSCLEPSTRKLMCFVLFGAFVQLRVCDAGPGGRPYRPARGLRDLTGSQQSGRGGRIQTDSRPVGGDQSGLLRNQQRFGDCMVAVVRCGLSSPRGVEPIPRSVGRRACALWTASQAS